MSVGAAPGPSTEPENSVLRRLLRLASVCLALLKARGHHKPLTLAGVLPLTTAGSGFAGTLPLARVSSQTFYLRSATGIAGCIRDAPRKQHCNRGREDRSGQSRLAHRPISFSRLAKFPIGSGLEGSAQAPGRT